MARRQQKMAIQEIQEHIDFLESPSNQTDWIPPANPQVGPTKDFSVLDSFSFNAEWQRQFPTDKIENLTRKHGK